MAVAQLAEYVSVHTAAIEDRIEAPSVVDVHFFRVLVDEHFDRDEFKRLLDDAYGVGEFCEITAARAAGGPSYIEWGAWIGDQGLALRMMGAGVVAGAWPEVLTPGRLGITGADADDLAGRGLVMTAPIAGDAR